MRRHLRSQSAVSIAASASDVMAPTVVACVKKNRSRQIFSISRASRPIKAGPSVRRISSMMEGPPVPMV